MRDVLLLSCVVNLQGSGSAKYKSCSHVPHSELMKSGSAQERVGHAHCAGCGVSHCTQTNKVRGEWIQIINYSTGQTSQQVMCHNSPMPSECYWKNTDYYSPFHNGATP